MTDVRLERDFPVPPARLFEAVSSRAMLLQWWGHEAMTLRDEALDLSRPGPWYSEMISDEGNRFKMSGQVTHVDPPRSVGFTWGWHDADDRRGPESHVTFTVEEIPGGSRLILEHCALAHDPMGLRHEAGWTSTLRRLERLLA